MIHNLYKATTKGDLEEVIKLLDEGRDINEKFDGGETALHGAAGFGNTKASDLLLSRGADPNSKDVNGSTPLHHAVESNSVQLVQILLSRGAAIDVQDEDCCMLGGLEVIITRCEHLHTTGIRHCTPRCLTLTSKLRSKLESCSHTALAPISLIRMEKQLSTWQSDTTTGKVVMVYRNPQASTIGNALRTTVLRIWLSTTARKSICDIADARLHMSVQNQFEDRPDTLKMLRLHAKITPSLSQGEQADHLQEPAEIPETQPSDAVVLSDGANNTSGVKESEDMDLEVNVPVADSTISEEISDPSTLAVVSEPAQTQSSNEVDDKHPSSMRMLGGVDLEPTRAHSTRNDRRQDVDQGNERCHRDKGISATGEETSEHQISRKREGSATSVRNDTEATGRNIPDSPIQPMSKPEEIVEQRSANEGTRDNQVLQLDEGVVANGSSQHESAASAQDDAHCSDDERRRYHQRPREHSHNHARHHTGDDTGEEVASTTARKSKMETSDVHAAEIESDEPRRDHLHRTQRSTRDRRSHGYARHHGSSHYSRSKKDDAVRRVRENVRNHREDFLDKFATDAPSSPVVKLESSADESSDASQIYDPTVTLDSDDMKIMRSRVRHGEPMHYEQVKRSRRDHQLHTPALQENTILDRVMEENAELAQANVESSDQIAKLKADRVFLQQRIRALEAEQKSSVHRQGKAEKKLKMMKRKITEMLVIAN